MTKIAGLLGESMMNKEMLLREAEYADIILTLLNSPYAITSITELIFIAFCVKHESNLSAYRNRSKDFIDIFLRIYHLSFLPIMTILNLFFILLMF